LCKAKESVDDMLAFVKSVGCEAIELNGHPENHPGLWTKPVDFAAIRKKLDDAGIVATALGGYTDMAQPTDEGLAQQIDTLVDFCASARALGIPVVRAFSGDAREGYPIEVLYPRIVAGLKAATDKIAGWGVKIGMENHGHGLNTGEKMLGLIKDVGSPLLGMTLDTGNFCWAGNSVADAHRFFEMLAPYTFSVHVKDGRWLDRFRFVPVSWGLLDITIVMRALVKAGYQGGVLSEYEGKSPETEMGTAVSVAYLKGLRDALAR
jgi:sugar phosphate isomerase/epimerase